MNANLFHSSIREFRYSKLGMWFYLQFCTRKDDREDKNQMRTNLDWVWLKFHTLHFLEVIKYMGRENQSSGSIKKKNNLPASGELSSLESPSLK